MIMVLFGALSAGTKTYLFYICILQHLASRLFEQELCGLLVYDEQSWQNEPTFHMLTTCEKFLR